MSWTRGELADKIAEQAASNSEYRALLKKDPRALLTKQLGTDVPASMNIKVLEETPDTYYIVLPYTPSEGQELADEDLEKVAGGFLDKTCKDSTLSTVVNVSF